MTKFVLLSHPRTGSTMLTSSLCQHPQLVMLGEIFNEEKEERSKAIRRIAWIDRNVIPYNSTFSGKDYLKRIIFFQRYKPNLVAIGFKLFYNQANFDPAKSAWDFLSLNKDIKIIHLTRNNLLASYISLQYALKSGNWVYTNEKKENYSNDQLTIDPQKCQRFIQHLLRKKDEMRKVFKNHPYMEINYENDLCQNFDITIKRIQIFLNTTNIISLPIHTIRSAERFHQDIVSNFTEVLSYFENSRFNEQTTFS